MPYKKGESGNLAGKPKGAANRSTEYLRHFLKTFVEANIETIQRDYDSMEPKDRLLFLEKLIKHVLPPPFSIERLTDEQLDQVINHLKNSYNG